MLKLRDIMTRDVVTVSPELSLRDAIELLTAKHIGGAPVVAGRKVVGVVTSTDLLGFAALLPRGITEQREGEVWESPDEEPLAVDDESEANAAYFSDIWEDSGAELDGQLDRMFGPEWTALDEHTVGEVMSRDVRSLSPLTSVCTAADFMRRAGIHRVLVMTDGTLQGIVSASDIVRAVADHQIREDYPPSRPVVQEVRYVPVHELDFDSGWSHEPVVSER